MNKYDKDELVKALENDIDFAEAIISALAPHCNVDIETGQYISEPGNFRLKLTLGKVEFKVAAVVRDYKDH